jgi:hypothetical protein
VALRPCGRLGRPELRRAAQTGAEDATVVSVVLGWSVCPQNICRSDTTFAGLMAAVRVYPEITTVPIDESSQPDLA